MSAVLERDPVAFATAAARRCAAASSVIVRELGGIYGLGPVRLSAADVPRLLALLDDERRRAGRVRALHDACDADGGRLLCGHCSTPWAPADWPCETARLLDGDLAT